MTTNPVLPTTQAERLAVLRYAVLVDLENQNHGPESTSLTDGGQADLSFIFPRTAKLAGIDHAGQAATLIYDDRVRDRGFHHLFRLPTFWESQIHRASLGMEGLLHDRPSSPVDLIQFITNQSPAPENAKEGAVNLDELDLNQLKEVRKLAQVHADAMAAGTLVIPFFRLA